MDQCDALRAAKLCERDQVLILLLRDDRAKLQVSKVYPNAGAHSLGALLKSRGCPCGRGAQDRHHLLWRCQLARVEEIRRDRLAPAVRDLSLDLDALEPVTKRHHVCAACVHALESKSVPHACSGMDGIRPVSLDATASGVACLRLMLGVVATAGEGREVQMVLRKARPMLAAICDMQHAVECASAKATLAMQVESLRRRQLRDALHHIRVWTWLHPRPAGGQCLCCPGGVHCMRDAELGSTSEEHFAVRPVTAQPRRGGLLCGWTDFGTVQPVL